MIRQQRNNSKLTTNLTKARHRLEVRGQFFSQRVVKQWNDLPAQLKRAKTPAAFKKDFRL